MLFIKALSPAQLNELTEEQLSIRHALLSKRAQQTALALKIVVCISTVLWIALMSAVATSSYSLPAIVTMPISALLGFLVVVTLIATGRAASQKHELTPLKLLPDDACIQALNMVKSSEAAKAWVEGVVSKRQLRQFDLVLLKVVHDADINPNMEACRALHNLAS